MLKIRYYDQNYNGFGSLRVINEDRVEPGEGFGAHPHREMEIFSYIVSGELEQYVSRTTFNLSRHLTPCFTAKTA